MAEETQQKTEDTEFDHNADRYPDLETIFSAVLASDRIPDGPVDFVEVTALASGEATFKVRAAREEEPQGGYLGNLSER